VTASRAQLGRELKHLREFAGLNGRDLAARIRDSGLDMSQSKVSRIESGAATVTRPEVQAWADATDAARDTRERLMELAEAAFTELAVWRNAVRAGKRHLQDQVRAREATAHTIRNFQPTVVPGLLQTPEYAHWMIPLADLACVIDHAASAVARLKRQPALFDTDRQFEFLIGECALHWNPAPSTDLLVAQLDRVASLAAMDNVHIGVLPIDGQAVAAPWNNFAIYEGDETVVMVELIHAGVRIADPEDVELYRGLYDRLRARAAKGPDAVALIQRIAAELRG
jgi:transcriptional regulator with XRE-family HTH domain